MRDPDVAGTLDDEAPALLWVRAAPDMAAAFARMFGVSEAAIDDMQAQALDGTGAAERDVEAWKLIHAPEAFKAPAEKRMLTTWLVHGPFHPHFKWFLVAVFHVRPVEGAESLVGLREHTSHVVVSLALAPDEIIDIEALESGESRHNAFGQWSHPVLGLTDDEQAVELLELVVRAMVDGLTSPDSDFKEHAGGIIDKTVEHYRYGGHPEFN